MGSSCIQNIQTICITRFSIVGLTQCRCHIKLLLLGLVTGFTSYILTHTHARTHAPTHVYTTLGSHMHLRYRHNCYLLAQLLGSYARYTPYTQYLFYGPVTGLMSHIHHIDTTATAQLMGPIHTNSAYMESLPPGPVTGLTSCIYQIHPLLLLTQQLSQYHAHALYTQIVHPVQILDSYTTHTFYLLAQPLGSHHIYTAHTNWVHTLTAHLLVSYDT